MGVLVDALLVSLVLGAVGVVTYASYVSVDGVDVAYNVATGAAKWVAASESPGVFGFRTLITLSGLRFGLSRVFWLVRPLAWGYRQAMDRE